MWDSATIEPMGNSVQRKTSVDVNRSSADAMTTSSCGRVLREGADAVPRILAPGKQEVHTDPMPLGLPILTTRSENVNPLPSLKVFQVILYSGGN